MKVNTSKSPEHKRAEREAGLIEFTLKYFGIRSRVMEVNLKKKWFEYCIAIKPGTSLENLGKIEPYISEAIGTQTDKVKIKAPINKNSLLRILVKPGKP